MYLRTIAILTATALLTLAVPMSTAHADNPLQDQIETVIATYGGEQIAPNQVSWDDGDITLTLSTGTTTRAVGTCATGKFCAYSQLNQQGSKLTFTTCTAPNSTSPIGSVRSVANARTSGTVTAYNGSAAVLTVAAGRTTNTGATITRLGC